MSGSIPKSLEGAQAPNTIELLWERHRKLLNAVFWLLAAGIAAFYGFKYYRQMQTNEKWSTFAASTFLNDTYNRSEAELRLAQTHEAIAAMVGDLREAPTARLEEALAAADDAEAPYYLWLIAVRAARSGDFDGAVSAAERLKSRFPHHPLCTESKYPVQVREPIEQPDVEETKPPAPGEKPELVKAVEGSAVDLLLRQLNASKGFAEPAHFAKPEIPADAPRYRVKLDGGYGEFVIALMPAFAPELCRKFEELAADGVRWWDGTKVDEITRIDGKDRRQPPLQQFHFGFEVTKTEANRSDWDTTKASPDDHIVQEFSTLSHFAGAVSARPRDGKSEVDHLYVCATDSPVLDGNQQVFAYVVEGMEAVRGICEASFAQSEDEQRGRGLPAENITIKSVELEKP